ncbi:MAG: hypothetical protein IPL64_13830 [Flavobacteriales bacterium]|nr:hypothetical protein [Flavobacteriales bacterium]
MALRVGVFALWYNGSQLAEGRPTRASTQEEPQPSNESCQPGRGRLAARCCYATALSSSSDRCIKDEIIQELGRALLLHGASTDYLSTVWSCGDTIPDEMVLDLLKTVNDKKLEKVKAAVEWATTLPQREQTAR